MKPIHKSIILDALDEMIEREKPFNLGIIATRKVFVNCYLDGRFGLYKEVKKHDTDKS